MLWDVRRSPWLWVFAVSGLALTGCGTNLPDEPGLYAVMADDEFQRLDGTPKWEGETWPERANFPSETRFLVLHPALSASPEPIGEKITLRKVGWVRSDIASNREIGPPKGRRWVTADIPGLRIPLDYNYVDGRPDLVAAKPQQEALEPGLYSLQLQIPDARVNARFGILWDQVDQQQYAATHCIDRYLEGNATTYRPCVKQRLAFSTEGLHLQLSETHKRVVDGRTVVELAGTVANVSGEPQTLPMFQGELKDPSDRMLYQWTFAAPVDEIAPGQSVPFHAVLDEVPDNVAKVTVRLSPTTTTQASGE